ncbi:damage-inducible protein DinB [Heyndrickxia oleronia]|uniref:DinB family protein n=1 Tax=Heyndrickxia oleronia TaxID=38875 RepID=UPI003335A0B3
MLKLFQYNWQVRDEWFNWCAKISVDELQCTRVGGRGSILRNLFHIVDVEQVWIRGLKGKTEFHNNFNDYPSLKSIRELSIKCRPEVEEYIQNWSNDIENHKLDEFTYGEVSHHVIVHVIHHIGQLSIWAREMGAVPVSAYLIGRGIYDR